MTGAMRKLADGDQTAEVPARDRRDEIGLMAGEVQVFKDNLIKAKESAAAQQKAQAAREADGRPGEEIGRASGEGREWQLVMRWGSYESYDKKTEHSGIMR